MKTTVYWLLVSAADFFTDIGFAHRPGVVARASLAIADACDAAALKLTKGGA